MVRSFKISPLAFFHLPLASYEETPPLSPFNRQETGTLNVEDIASPWGGLHSNPDALTPDLPAFFAFENLNDLFWEDSKQQIFKSFPLLQLCFILKSHKKNAILSQAW
jgi:hypothetical protein